MEKVLQVKNLEINFRTINGQLQAVRDVSFDLYRGETMAIVGESGSGKSVTSRAILGILANNAIVKGGKIYYDGKDLLKISEDQFHKIRGDKIAMIFQDPLSSLNPIMRIGKQLTEAMILKNRASRRESRKLFNSLMAELVKYMDMTGEQYEISNKQKSIDFNKFEFKDLELENAYNTAVASADDVATIIENLLFEVEKLSYSNCKRYINEIIKYAPLVQNEFFVKDITKINEQVELIKTIKKDSIKNSDYAQIISAVKIIDAEIKEAQKLDKPNFFSLAYYLTFVNPEKPNETVAELNKLTRKILDEEFMLEFIDRTRKALEISHKESIENSKLAITACQKLLDEFNKNSEDKKNIRLLEKEAIAAVENSIDKLDIYRTSPAYVFKSSIFDSLNLYYQADKLNMDMQKKYDKKVAAYNRITEKGKTPNWNLIPITLWNRDSIKNDIVENIQAIIDYLNSFVESKEPDYQKEAIDIIDYFKEKASNVVYKVTRQSAKTKAIKLMEEVGIPEPYKRYRQYPFEFSGGMRQRIVIAIALAANPEILICDEPTTALDVTIQSQILELINKLKAERNLSIIFITHDMGVVANMADRISVMYAGKIVETGTCDDIFYDPRHPYTWALLSSMPSLDTKEKLDSIPGTPPNMINPPVGDAFAARNKYAMKIDFEKQPPLFKVSDTHYAATWLLHPSAPKVELPKTLVDRIENMKKVGVTSDGTVQ
ncbi:MAG: ATP-binding cassette domain-containing protein [Anaeroplasmataceae bacterium]|nr:ATP-binding cassette domain-containing protein [Anaeroplasmataceae bacterium]